MEGEVSPKHPVHPKHPKHPDNHPLRVHHPHHHLLHQITGFFILFTLFITFLVGMLSNAPFGSVLLGFAPTIIFALLVLVIANQDHLEMNYLVFALIATMLIAGIIFWQIIPDADAAALTGLNFVLGAIFIIILQQSYAHHEEDLGGEVVEIKPDQREISSLFADIEERAKQLNTAIGRTYSVYKNATAGMREKIKIQSALYSQLDAEKKASSQRDVLKEIQARLHLLKEPEQEVFTQAEQKKLGRAGTTSVLNVLADNEGEGVLQAHAAALAYTENALEQLS